MSLMMDDAIDLVAEGKDVSQVVDAYLGMEEGVDVVKHNYGRKSKMQGHASTDPIGNTKLQARQHGADRLSQRGGGLAR